MKLKKRAFTLIELLIVVAIIAILAAIAVPNFLEAQTRSKVSRVKADQRTLLTAIESYAVDNNVPPPAAGEVSGLARPGFVGDLVNINGQNASGVMGWWISTPIAYITTAWLPDPFVTGKTSDIETFTYQTYVWRWPKNQPNSVNDSVAESVNERMTGAAFQELYGFYRLISVGPDQDFNNDLVAPFNAGGPLVGVPYDPTNGTISAGNIIRSQKGEPQTYWTNGAIQ